MPAMGKPDRDPRSMLRQSAPTDIYVGCSRHLAGLANISSSYAADAKPRLPVGSTDAIAEHDGRILKVEPASPGVSATTKSLAPSSRTNMADFLKQEWKGKIATPRSRPLGPDFDDRRLGPRQGDRLRERPPKQLAGLHALRRDRAARDRRFLVSCENTAPTAPAEVGIGSLKARRSAVPTMPTASTVVNYFYRGGAEERATSQCRHVVRRLHHDLGRRAEDHPRRARRPICISFPNWHDQEGPRSRKSQKEFAPNQERTDIDLGDPRAMTVGNKAWARENRYRQHPRLNVVVGRCPTCFNHVSRSSKDAWMHRDMWGLAMTAAKSASERRPSLWIRHQLGRLLSFRDVLGRSAPGYPVLARQHHCNSVLRYLVHR